MRNLFVVFSKILGLLCIYWAILTIPSVGLLVGSYDSQAEPFGFRFLIVMAITFSLYLLFAWILLLRTDKLADLLKIREGQEQVSRFSPESLLCVGVILVGIYLLASAIPQFIKTFAIALKSSRGFSDIHRLSQLLSTIVQMALGVVLSFSAKRVVCIITRKETITT
ncbi:MAG: hypothetical protein P9M08_00345 [Candidatus Erginobacter occultus]|nr:hypothetical protein [Candidatus Erginobacter occultus]